MNNDKVSNIVLIIILGIYVLSPADLIPGPVDDIVLVLLYALTNNIRNRAFHEPDAV